MSDLFEIPAALIREKITIAFDGGTPCNVPAKGYGDGYGSYRVIFPGNRTVQERVNFMRPMSANAAEIFTLVKGIERVLGEGYKREEVKLHITGDSQIALKWASGQQRRGKPQKIAKSASEEFRNAIESLRWILAGFSETTTEWKPRKFSVAMFGH